jgi:hypothetical protein
MYFGTAELVRSNNLDAIALAYSPSSNRRTNHMVA